MSHYTYDLDNNPPVPETVIDVPELRVMLVDERRGRPMFLTPRRFIHICQWIEKGESALDACKLEFVSYQSFRQHVRKKPKYQRRLKQAEEVREHYLREFHMANIKRHSAKTVAASMFWLERRYPNEFALRTVIRDTVEAEARAVFDKISMEQLIENARLAAEIAAKPPSGLVPPPSGLPLSDLPAPGLPEKGVAPPENSHFV